MRSRQLDSRGRYNQRPEAVGRPATLMASFIRGSRFVKGGLTMGTSWTMARRLSLACIALSLIGLFVSRPRAMRSPAQAASSARAPAPTAPIGNLNQLMRAILFPNSNIIFNVQQQDPAAETPSAEKSAGNGFSITAWGDGLYPRWEVVSYAALALDESAALITAPGRHCQNGKPVPINDPGWVRFSAALSATAQDIYAAAEMKNRDAVIELTNTLTDTCANCHNVYRRGAVGGSDRCAPKP
jgi:hypothetical protein